MRLLKTSQLFLTLSKIIKRAIKLDLFGTFRDVVVFVHDYELRVLNYFLLLLKVSSSAGNFVLSNVDRRKMF